MNFYQSWLRKTINSKVLWKPMVNVDLFGKQYRWTLKQQKYLWKTLRWWMIQWVQFKEWIPLKQRNKQVIEIQSQLVHGRWDFLLQLWCTNILDASSTTLIKQQDTRDRLREIRETLQSRLLWEYNLEQWLRTHMPDATILLDLTLDEKAYRKQLSTSGKRYINKWKKAGLEVVQASKQQREQFWEVRYKTWYDKWFNVLPKQQFLRLRDFCMVEEVWTLFVWLKDGIVVTGGVYLKYWKQLIYLYGATDRSWWGIWAQYRLTDQIIRWWNEQNYRSMDLLGVAPVGFESWHSWAWVTRFKQAFGGQTVSYRGSYDIVFNSWVMKAFEWKRKLKWFDVKKVKGWKRKE